MIGHGLSGPEERVRLLPTLAFALCAALAIFATFSPLGVAPGNGPGPHLLLIVVGFWRLRRPAAAPTPLIFVFGLLLDLLRPGPIGAELFALLMIATALMLMRPGVRARALWEETLIFAAAAVIFEAITYCLLAASFAQPPAFYTVLTRLGWTIASFPLAVVLFGWLLGVRNQSDTGFSRRRW